MKQKASDDPFNERMLSTPHQPHQPRDDDVYNLIMKDKEQLLSNDEPLRFIFSHSALREGWDNPNVFQICTLNETKSAMKKRQEIGRGLRLPVDQDGRRVFDEAINKLYVMANESYEDFARALQTEYEEDCGVTFGKVPLTALARITRAVDGQEVPIGKDAAEAIRAALVGQKMLEADGRLGVAFDPRKKDFKLELPPEYSDLQPSIPPPQSPLAVHERCGKCRSRPQP
jgi:type III restriction enzyme